MRALALLTLGASLGIAGALLVLLPHMDRKAAARAVGDLSRLMGQGSDERARGGAVLQCWGDSLTAGAGAAAGHDFPALMTLLFHRPTFNRGISGETSRQIRDRMLSRPASAGPEDVVIWAGRNDDLSRPIETERNIADMVASLPPGSHFLVLDILNADVTRERVGGDRYRAITSLNQRLRSTYGAHLVAVRDLLISKAAITDGRDAEAVRSDVVPPSLRSDGLHLDDGGDAFVAFEIESAIRAGAW